ncbi:CBS domain-containing protein [Halobacillus karajensis]|uniref:Hypoxic response protein 1 n=1 Tax=Halobacillus karajensis TaxID=195088 RepID=A0A024P629_9BACI|nr:CBS domain-containing protein [Halobacillus karajensis]CDQ20728.1 Hypoxic response protein 1 [Halobacillus karajensis]CDQ23802.1 Hypoxic response protein 1 [Halobacillus karajensis]CDQ27280.1 Hypoxic response protein 1 [Halobacillus karajensis]SEI05214.1 CBS domain-containing protein [Halobacillus karajensis]
MSVVKELLNTDLATCKATDDLFTVAKQMKDADVGFVPLVEGEKFVGVVTDRDIVVKGLAKGSADHVKASDVMTEKIITGYPDMHTEEAARLMQEHQIKRLLVVENDSVKGVVSLGDVGVQGSDEAAADIVREVSKGAANN